MARTICEVYAGNKKYFSVFCNTSDVIVTRRLFSEWKDASEFRDFFHKSSVKEFYEKEKEVDLILKNNILEEVSAQVFIPEYDEMADTKICIKNNLITGRLNIFDFEEEEVIWGWWSAEE